MAITPPRYIVRLVHYQNNTYALHFELDESTNDSRSPTPDNLKNVSIGYNDENSDFLIIKDPLDRSIAAQVIFQFTKTISSQHVPLLRRRVDPTEEFDVLSYIQLYQLCQEGEVLGNVFLVALESAYIKTGGRTTSRSFVGYMLDFLIQNSQILPVDELHQARDMLFSAVELA